MGRSCHCNWSTKKTVEIQPRSSYLYHPDGNDSRRCCHNDPNFSRRACVRLDHRLLTYDGLILFRKSKTRFDVRETQADDQKIFRQMTVSSRRSRWLSAPAGDRATWKIATWIGPPPDIRTNPPDVTKFSLRYSVITVSIVVIGCQYQFSYLREQSGTIIVNV